MKRSIKILLSAAFCGLACNSALFAGNVTYDFETIPDPASNPQFTGALIVGSHSVNYGTPQWQVWSSGAGAPVGGNPGGYLSIADANLGGQNLAFVFPDIDNGLPLKGFVVDLDLRAGNGTLGRPADGFSISFARAGDQVLINATNGTANGFAGGDSLAAAQAAAGSGDAENGTKSGVSVLFDAWQGNYLPDTPPADGIAGDSNDREGIAVRVDDATYIQLNLINNRNGVDCIPSPQTSTADSGGGLSMQTGTNEIVLSGTNCSRIYGAQDVSGSFTNLVWQRVHVQLVPTTTNTYNLNVVYKGVTVINTNLASFAPSTGRLVLAGRTGGNNQNCHFDNIHLVTIPTTNATLSGVVGLLNGFTFTISDNTGSGSILTNVSKVTLDNVDVTALTHVSYSSTNGQAPLSFGIYTQAVRLAPLSTHNIFISWLDDFGVSSFGNFSFTVPPWVELSASTALPLSAVDQTKPGFLISGIQDLQNNPNAIPWTEEEVIGMHGRNIAGAPSLTPESGAYMFNGPLDFANIGGVAIGNGMFTPSEPLSDLGFGFAYPKDALHDSYDNCALEIYSYVYFPTSGIYNMVIGSDDSFQLSTAGNPRDRMGTVLASLSGNALPNPSGRPVGFNDIRPFIIDTPGVYPIRLLYENGGGAAGLEWYTVPGLGVAVDPGVNSFLVNDTNNPTQSILAFRALAAGQTSPPYILRAVPVRNAVDALYYQPVVVDISDGAGDTVVGSSIALTIDGVPSGYTASGSGVTRVTQIMTNSFSVGLHTNLLTFSDSLGGNHSYTWAFTVIGAANGITAADPTNTPAILPLASRVDPSTLSNPGFIINSFQNLFKNGGSSGTAEEELMGLLGTNVALNAGLSTFNIDAPVDYRFPAGTGTGSGGEWVFDGDLRQFGFVGELLNNLAGTVPVNIDNAMLEMVGYIVFPAAGNYLMHFNSDDGFKIASPNNGYLFDKLGTELGWADVGRGIAGPAGGIQTGGTYFMVSVPSAGAYPIRAIWFNGTGDAAFEWSVYVKQADGTYIKELVNDPSAPVPINFFQTSSAGANYGPYVSYVNPAPDSFDKPWFSPTVVDLTDGPSRTTDATKIDSLTQDGVAQTFSATKAGSVTKISQQLNAPLTYGRNHTNVLVFHDSSGTSYTNQWFFNVFGTAQTADADLPGTIAAYATLNVPASLSVPIASLDLSQPGFRIKSYQTTAGNNNTVTFTEQQFAGLQGPNIATNDIDPLPISGYYTWPGPIDFCIRPGGVGNATSAEWSYDFPFTNPPSNFGFVYNPPPPDTSFQMNNNSLMIGAYLVFTHPGTYIMVVPSDDCFKLSIPYGDPFNAAGLIVGDCNAGRGAAGGGYGPRGGATYCPFNITNAGAYPFRLLWENGGGGSGVELSVFQALPDGSVNYGLVNDPNSPSFIAAYQVTTNQPPFVAFINPVPGLVYGNAQPTISLSGNGLNSNPSSVQQDVTFSVANSMTTVDTNQPMSLTFQGIAQPFTLGVSNGLLVVTRPASSAQFWPSGALGELVFNFHDNTGAAQSLDLGKVTTPFWGTLTTPTTQAVDTNSPGWKLRLYALDDHGGQGLNNRIHQAEQVLTGIWGTNAINPAHYPTNALVNGYFLYPGANGSTSSGVINFDFTAGTVDGDFNAAAFPDNAWPGIPSLAVPNNQNNFVGEFLAYVNFPTNGIYTLGVSSDDGFRVISDTAGPTNNGALIVNTPAALSGKKAAAQDATYSSFIITNPVSGQLVVAQGPFTASTTSPYAQPNEYGSTNFLGLGYSADGCIINNSLAGKIALIFRSPFCGYQQQVANAEAAGAIGVVIVNYPQVFTNGAASPNQMPNEPAVSSPPLAIPTVGIEWADGIALLQATSTPNVTITPMQYVVNPPAGNNVLGQIDVGKGASDVLFPVVVTTAGTYPIRVTYFQGGGGANAEFFQVVRNGATNTRILVNDVAGGSPLKAYMGLASATVSIKLNANGTITVTFTGTLQSESSLIGNNWVDMTGVTSPYTFTPTGTPLFFRSHL